MVMLIGTLIIIHYCNQTKISTENKNTEKKVYNNMQNSRVVTNLPIFYMNSGITLLACMDFWYVIMSKLLHSTT